MLDGVHLTLLAGPVIALPVPKLVLDALQSVTVESGTDGPGAAHAPRVSGDATPA